MNIKQKYQGYLFVLPTVFLLVLILGFPAFMAVVNSVTPIWSEGFSFTLENYTKLIHDPVFLNAFSKTAYFVGTTVFIHFLIGLPVAMALNAQIRARNFFRVLAILPWTVPDVISGLAWRYMLNPTQGIVNHILMSLGIVDTQISWLGNPQLAMPSVILAEVWRAYPFVMVILLAGLQAIPEQLYEAARVDGATFLQVFRYITLPQLKRPFAVALALDVIWEFRRFGVVYTMTQGGPGHATEIFSMRVYKEYFDFFNFEYASAMAIVVAGIMLLITLPYVKTMVSEA
ncbi:sugar ABC transporter permease [Candidatus Bipolaricaulota bacterium]|nr:sugar ABC transporter permease [Candidatus Bipolaricaulota bacterium]